jgi:hypothetical protein
MSAHLTVDRFERKAVFKIPNLGMSLRMASLAVSVWVVQNHYTYAASVAATFFLFFYMEFPPRL